MTAPTRIDIPFSLNQAHLLRSQFIEQWALIEQRLAIAAVRSDMMLPAKASFGQRIEALRSGLLARGQPSRTDRSLIAICEALTALIPLRNELVHGTMQHVRMDDQDMLLLANATRVLEPLTLRVLVSVAELRVARGQAAQLAHRLHQIVNPQPSPPRPSPRAAAGP